jgi:DNA-binding PadR family transcriptional regulator
MNKQLQKFSPLTEASYYILLSFYHTNHGYGVIKQVEEMTDGRLTIAAGTLYGAITTFLKNKLITLDNIEGPKKKKTYMITELGKELLQFEYNRLQELVSNSKEVLQ